MGYGYLIFRLARPVASPDEITAETVAPMTLQEMRGLVNVVLPGANWSDGDAFDHPVTQHHVVNFVATDNGVLGLETHGPPSVIADLVLRLCKEGGLTALDTQTRAIIRPA